MEKKYKVIALRWRPKSFDELVGQDHIVRTLKNAIKSKRIAHAYLFVGPRGTGKTSTARLFAKCLNADGGPSVAPDENSPLAQSIMNGTCMDVIEIDGASNNSVDQIRSLREDCQYVPTQGAYKIYIIDEVHMLTTAAFNALLKTLEEPPSHVIFIFATTEASKVLPTIVSRCQRFEFKPIGTEVISSKLKEIIKDEGIKVEEGVYSIIAELAEGGMRDAQSILDQLISFCGDQIRVKEVLDIYGLVSREEIKMMGQVILGQDYAEVMKLIQMWIKEGRDFYRAFIGLQHYFKEILIKVVSNNEGMEKEMGRKISPDVVMRIMDCLEEGKAKLKEGMSDDLNFEVAILRTVEQSRFRSIDHLLEMMDKMNGHYLNEGVVQKKNLIDKAIETEMSVEPVDLVEIREVKVEGTEGGEIDSEVLKLLPESVKNTLDSLFKPKYSVIEKTTF